MTFIEAMEALSSKPDVVVINDSGYKAKLGPWGMVQCGGNSEFFAFHIDEILKENWEIYEETTNGDAPKS